MLNSNKNNRSHRVRALADNGVGDTNARGRCPLGVAHRQVMMKTGLHAGLFAVLVLAAAACGSGETGVPDSGSQATSEPSTTIAVTNDSAVDAGTTVLDAPIDTATTTTTNDGATDESGADFGAAADRVIEVEVRSGALVGDFVRHDIALGDTVMIVVAVDVADEVHVHAYDVFGDATPDTPAMVMVTADIPGIFEVELEGARVPLLELQVS